MMALGAFHSRLARLIYFLPWPYVAIGIKGELGRPPLMGKGDSCYFNDLPAKDDPPMWEGPIAWPGLFVDSVNRATIGNRAPAETLFQPAELLWMGQLLSKP